jgi:hypothetical protein
LLPNKTYADFDAGLAKIEDEDSLVTWFVQHPIQIKPPGDNGPPQPKPLMLTKKVMIHLNINLFNINLNILSKQIYLL